jgi:hypothetical protein
MDLQWKVTMDQEVVALCPDKGIAELIREGLYGLGYSNLLLEGPSLTIYQVSIPTNNLFNGEPCCFIVSAGSPKEAREMCAEEASDFEKQLWLSAKVDEIGKPCTGSEPSIICIQMAERY